MYCWNWNCYQKDNGGINPKYGMICLNYISTRSDKPNIIGFKWVIFIRGEPVLIGININNQKLKTYGHIKPLEMSRLNKQIDNWVSKAETEMVKWWSAVKVDLDVKNIKCRYKTCCHHR